MKKEQSIFKFCLPCLFILFSLFMEMICFLWLGFSAFPKYFLFDFAIILFIACLMYFIPNFKFENAVFFILISIQTILNIVNTTMYNIFGDILSFDLIYLGAEATSALTPEFIDWGGFFLNLSILGAFITIVVILEKTIKKTFIIRKYSTLSSIIAVVLAIQFFSVYLYQFQKTNLNSPVNASSQITDDDSYLFDNFQFKIDAYKKFGYFGFYFKSFSNLLFHDEPSDEEISYIKTSYKNGWSQVNSDALMYDDNLIVILCESLDFYAIDPINTPTLWSIFYGENSITATNFYARNRTNVSEGIVLLGNMPRDSSLSSIVKKGYNFEFSLPNVFKNSSTKNTTTTFIHANTKSFYNRDITHGINGIGFDNIYTIEDYEGEQNLKPFHEWISDYEFIKYFADDIFLENERFLTFFASISTHGPYNNQNQYFGEYYEKYYNNLDEYKIWMENNTEYNYPTSEPLKTRFENYKCAFMDFDKTVAYILEQLKEKGIQDKTNIVFFADHNAYYYNLCNDIKNVDKQDFSNLYINNIPMAIYSPKLVNNLNGQNKFEKFCNTYDIFPTICELYGLSYNKFMCQGYNIFSNEIENSFFSSNLNGMFDDKIYSLNIEEIYYDQIITDEDVEKFTTNAIKFYEKQHYLEESYKFNIQ